VKRRVFNLLAALSLLLCVANTVLWVRGFWVSDLFVMQHWERQGQWYRCVALVYEGDCSQFWATFRIQTGTATAKEIGEWDRHPPAFLQFSHGANERSPFQLRFSASPGRPWERVGFEYDGPLDIRMPPGINDHTVRAPFWFVLLASGAVPAFWLARQQARRSRRSRVRRQVCVHCGYDLRATPERCPECGSPAAPKPADAIATSLPN